MGREQYVAAKYRVGSDLKYRLMLLASERETSAGNIILEALGKEYGMPVEKGNHRVPRLPQLEGDVLWVRMPSEMRARINMVGALSRRTSSEVVAEALGRYLNGSLQAALVSGVEQKP